MVLAETKNKILFYDGDCGFCNSSVQFVLNNKKRPNIYFAALQSDFAKNILKSHQIDIKLDTLYFLTDNKVFAKSSGVLRICKHLKFPFSLFWIFLIIPKFVRNYFYSFIAKRRHKLKAGYCMIPNKTDKSLFLTD